MFVYELNVFEVVVKKWGVFWWFCDCCNYYFDNCGL